MEKIFKLLKGKNINIVEKKIYSELKKINFNFSRIGTIYLAECINEVYKTNKLYEINLNKEIFPIISFYYKKEISTIQSDIRKSIESMYYNCDKTVLMKYFDYYIIKKPTLKEIIIKVIEKLKN